MMFRPRCSQKLEVHPVGDVREVLRLALEPAAAAAEPAAVPDAA